jgi:hypothetical protein
MIYLICRYKVGILLSLIIWTGLAKLLGWKGILLLVGATSLVLIGYGIWTTEHQPKGKGK